MNRIEAEFEIVTPMFVGGANQKGAEIRPPSVKGALRFWWRALHWSQFLAAADNDQRAALKQLHGAEAALFGAAAGTGFADPKQTGSQSAYLLRIDARNAARTTNPPAPREDPGRAYLGYGLFKMGRHEGRGQGLDNRQTFKLRLLENPRADIDDDQRASVRAAVRAWGLFGGLGARARRGFGSVAMTRMDGDEFRYQDLASYLNAGRRFIHEYGACPSIPPYTAFSRHARFEAFATDNNANHAHEKLGKTYKTARGENGIIKGQDKKAFGLPLAGYDNESRRGSPLLMHVHPLAECCVSVGLLLPAPMNAKDSIPLEPIQTFLDKNRLQ